MPTSLSVETWTKDHPIQDQMLWKGAAKHQIEYFAGKLFNVLREDHPSCLPEVSVISSHPSKSIDLPVVRFDRKDIGLSFVIRDNFHDYKLSVISDGPIEADFRDLFDTSYGPPDYYCEGFPDELVFPSYDDNKFSFTADIHKPLHLEEVLRRCVRAKRGVKIPRRTFWQPIGSFYARLSARMADKMGLPAGWKGATVIAEDVFCDGIAARIRDPNTGKRLGGGICEPLIQVCLRGGEGRRFRREANRSRVIKRLKRRRRQRVRGRRGF